MAKAKQSTKAQGELDGFEKPSIPDLDELCAAQLKASRASKKATDKLAAAKAATKAFMDEHRGDLEEDADSNPVYGYQDGDEEKVFKLRQGEDLVVTNAKKPKLEAVED